MTFDQHRADCKQCNAGPYNLCDDGAGLLIDEESKKRPREPMMPWTQRQISAYVASLLRRLCDQCGARLVKHMKFELDIVCPNRLTETDWSKAQKHACYPIDTGPFSLGRRVD